jgi:hypothetical protein
MTTVNMPTLRCVKSDVYISRMVNKDLEMVYKYKKDHPVSQLERTTHKLGPHILQVRFNRCITYS